jgi:hypothetical protein
MLESHGIPVIVVNARTLHDDPAYGKLPDGA